ncbi:hypothetical protein PM082_009079 [Marasmius tenuissimus]|nr:hypothetical protein PM082_009079 [Marasmius tenuissimus]
MVSLTGTDQQLARHLEEVFGDKEKLRGFLGQTGEDAQNWLDRLQQLTDTPDLNVTTQLRSSMFTVMIRLSKLSGLHPRSLLMRNVHKVGKHPIAAGGFGDVWKGVIGQSESEGQLVCLKVSKVYVKSDLDTLFKEYLREALVWRQLSHQNVLPFLGIFYLKDDRQFCLISPWMENGNLLQYLKATLRANVDHLALVYDVAAGLAYLHGGKVVHGDLKGLNILITPEGRACITDFGLSRIADTLALKLTTSSARPAGTARWLSQEILQGGSGPTKESDVYAFACVCYEIYTALPPFHELTNDAAVIFHVVVSKKCPARPVEVSELDDGMWNIMEACWSADPTFRPNAAKVLARIESEALVERKRLINAEPWPPQWASHSLAHETYKHEHPADLEGGVEVSNPQIQSLSIRDGITTQLDAELASPNPHPQPPVADADDLDPGLDRLSDSDKGKRPVANRQKGSWWQKLRPNKREQRKRTSWIAASEAGWLSKWTAGGHEKGKDHTPGQAERSQSLQPVYRENQGELTRMIGFLTATSCEDWALVLDVCERATASEANTKEATRAFRREFKYGQPQAQLSAARASARPLTQILGLSTSCSTFQLWGIILRNASDTFMSHSTSQRFLNTIEDLCLSDQTNPIVKERVLEVIAAASYGSANKEYASFQTLWRKVKPRDKPEEGIPFDSHDPTFNPPAHVDRNSWSNVQSGSWPVLYPNEHFAPQKHLAKSDRIQLLSLHGINKSLPPKPGDGDVKAESVERHRDQRRDSDGGSRQRDEDEDWSQRGCCDTDSDEHSLRDDKNQDPYPDRESSSGRERKDKDRESRKRKKHRSSRERERDAQKIIPPEEDIRRLFQECIIGKGFASLLSQALVHTTPEDFLSDNTEGQSNGIIREFRMKCIASQELIAAQIPWASAGSESSERSRRELNAKRKAEGKPIAGEEDGETTEEKLLADLLSANEELLGALGQYEDLERVAMERKAEEDSKKGTEGRGRDEELLGALGQYEDLERLAREKKAEEDSKKDVGGRRRREKIERQLHQEELYLSSNRAAPMSARSPSPSLHPGGARVPSRSPSSSPSMPPPPVPPRIPSPDGCSKMVNGNEQQSHLEEDIQTRRARRGPRRPRNPDRRGSDFTR